MEPKKKKITIIKKSDTEARKAASIASMKAFEEYNKPFYFAKHCKS